MVEESKSFRPGSTDSKQTKKSNKHLFGPKFSENPELFFAKWAQGESNEQIHIDLLNEFINDAKLRFNVLKRKQEFLICLKQ